jgi:hypothetical protein
MTQATASSPAPDSSAGKTPDDRSTTFQPVEGGTEQHSGATLLIEAYAVLWVILMAWLVFQWRRQTALNARLEGLERAIDRAAVKAEKAEKQPKAASAPPGAAPPGAKRHDHN